MCITHLVERKHTRKGEKKGEKKKQRARTKVQASKEPKRGEPQGGNGTITYQKLN
jgi:hypothetical protein